MDAKPTVDELRAALEQNLQDIKDNFWDASPDDQIRLVPRRKVLADALEKLNREDIESRDPVYGATLDFLGKQALPALDALSKDIAAIIHDVDVSAKVVQNIAKTLDLLARYLA